MKKTILAIFILINSVQLINAQYCGNSGSAICVPGQSTTMGLSPVSDSLPPIFNGSTCATVIHFKCYDTLNFGGSQLTVQTLGFDSITNLPSGLCWATNKNNNTFANSEDGCISISGTCCSAPGQYRLGLYCAANIGFTIHTSAAAFGVYYYLRVNNTGDTFQAVDTTGQSNNPQSASFVSYGGASNCVACACNTISSPLTLNAGTDKTVCSGSNVILDPIVSGGQAPYSFVWSSTGNALNCSVCKNPGVVVTQNSSYSVTVTDAANNTLTGTVNYTVSGSGSLPQITASNSDFVCNSIYDTTTMNITGGVSPYNVTWGDGSGVDQSHTYTHNYSQSGLYVLSAQDGNGCLNAVFDTVKNRGVIVSTSYTVSPLCPGTNTGKIAITTTGGQSPYTFAWSNGAHSDSLIGVQSGSYAVTVTDVNSCSARFYQYLSAVHDAYYYTYLTSIVANCGNSGSVNSQLYGGTPPFIYYWSNGATTQYITQLQGGVYVVTVTDSFGCNATGNITVGTDCYSVISGVVFDDANSNCIKDSGDAAISGMYIEANNGANSYYAITDDTGGYYMQVYGTGTYTISVDYWGGSGFGCGNSTLCGNANNTVAINTDGQVSLHNNVGYTVTNGYDLTMHPGWSSANPGFEKEYWILPFDQAYTQYNGPATLVFKYDSNLIYENSNTPVPVHDPLAHTLTWTLNALSFPYYDWDNGRLENFFMVPVTLPVGYLLQSDMYITPTTGDCDSSNNHMHFSEVVTGSHDPNEKTVEPAAGLPESDSVLTYTIHFQNNGTDSTHFIIIKDTLSPLLDPASVVNIASSHPYSKFSITGAGILTWEFNPLRLVDSMHNEAGSKGFVMFKVKRKHSLPVGTTISNRASIYFDYNGAVVTNTASDTIARVTAIYELSNDNGVSVRAYPNPFTGITNLVVTGLDDKYDFEMFDLTGRTCKKMISLTANQFQVNRDNLGSGVYFYRISVSNKQVAFGKLIVQ